MQLTAHTLRDAGQAAEDHLTIEKKNADILVKS